MALFVINKMDCISKITTKSRKQQTNSDLKLKNTKPSFLSLCPHHLLTLTRESSTFISSFENSLINTNQLFNKIQYQLVKQYNSV